MEEKHIRPTSGFFFSGTERKKHREGKCAVSLSDSAEGILMSIRWSLLNKRRGWNNDRQREEGECLEAVIGWKGCLLRCWWWEGLVKQSWHEEGWENTRTFLRHFFLFPADRRCNRDQIWCRTKGSYLFLDVYALISGLCMSGIVWMLFKIVTLILLIMK